MLRSSVLLLLVAACTKAPFEDMRAQGIDRYLGVAQVESVENIEGATTTTFSISSGPRCLDGSVYRASIRPGNGKDLLIFLNGGGACWGNLCMATETANLGIFATGVLNPNLESNPFADFDVLFAPYCDGSLFAGDTEKDTDEDGEIDRYHYGLRNLSAALDLGKRTFPEPQRIILAGSSGGGFGTIAATMLVRLVWPDPELLVVNDSGVGLAKGHEPWFVQERLEEWNVTSMIPTSCEDCLADGHLTELISWQLEQDPRLKIGAFSFFSDPVIASLFLVVTYEQFGIWLRQELGALHQRFPDRYAAFLAVGTNHTALYSEQEMAVTAALWPGAERAGGLIRLGGYVSTEVEGQSLGQWIQAMLEGSAQWTQRVEASE